MLLFGFDFSVAKPAMCCYNTTTNKMLFYTWPSAIDKKSEEILFRNDVVVKNRNLNPIEKGTSNHDIVKTHTKRSVKLADMIIADMKTIIGETPIDEIYVATEGLSFGSTGNAMLELSGYKYMLLGGLYKLGITNIFTYPPTTIKSVAKLGRKLDKADYTKDFMIQSIKLIDTSKHILLKTIQYEEDTLKKKTSFVKTLDDLVDSYWALRTMCTKDLEINPL